jgi:hypothetical protein
MKKLFNPAFQFTSNSFLTKHRSPCCKKTAPCGLFSCPASWGDFHAVFFFRPAKGQYLPAGGNHFPVGQGGKIQQQDSKFFGRTFNHSTGRQNLWQSWRIFSRDGEKPAGKNKTGLLQPVFQINKKICSPD